MKNNRRDFLKQLSLAGLGFTGASKLISSKQFEDLEKFQKAHKEGLSKPKVKLVLIGTGSRGTGMWGRSVQEEYGDVVEFVGLCDINPGRVAYAKEYIGVDCPVYTDFEKMISETSPDALIVCTTDSTHVDYIVRGLEEGLTVISEKPMVIDEHQCQSVLDAERRTGNKVIVTFTRRYRPDVRQIWEILRDGRIGEITSINMNYFLDTSHGASYFRRWHGLKDIGGTLLVHKATHSFDEMNYWVNSEPEEVFAYGSLDFYGQKNSQMSHSHCRPCTHKNECRFYWDITRESRMMDLYVAHEHHDGYLRDGCVFRKEIDIQDTLSVQYKYANGVPATYTLNAFSPYEGYHLAIHGKEGRLDAWIKISMPAGRPPYQEITVTDLNGNANTTRVLPQPGGHGGSDPLLKDRLFRYPDAPDQYRQSAGSRDGTMSALVGIAARKSIETGNVIKIGDLTELTPQATKA
jgi:predicted dehydrogenase